MKKLLRIVGGTVAILLLALIVLRVVGLDPINYYPGFWLRGEVVTAPVTDWSFAVKDPNDPASCGRLFIQTKEFFLPAIAHSVTTSCLVYKGELYVASLYPAGIQFPNGRHWNRNVVNDPRVRLKVDGKLYDRKLVRLTTPEERADVLNFWVGKNGNVYAPGMYLNLMHAQPAD